MYCTVLQHNTAKHSTTQHISFKFKLITNCRYIEKLLIYTNQRITTFNRESKEHKDKDKHNITL